MKKATIDEVAEVVVKKATKKAATKKTAKKATKKAAASVGTKKGTKKKLTEELPVIAGQETALNGPPENKVSKVVRAVVDVDPTPVAELFRSQPPEPKKVSVQPNSVLLVINGTNKGMVDTSGQTMGDFVTAQAQRAGIRTFSVYLDGDKADTSSSKKPMSEFGKVEIVAKDARG